MSPLWLVAVAAWLAAYEAGLAVRRRRGLPWPSWRRACWWLAALALVGVWLLTPVAEEDRRLWAETLQFGLIAFAVAPLAFQGSPGALPTRPRRHPLDRLQHSPRERRLLQGGALAGFLLATIAWRLPGLVDALGAHPDLVGLEAGTVVGLTWPFWLAVAASPPSALLEHRPGRVALAGVATWSVWTFAYAVGFSGRPFYPAFDHGASAVSAQEWSVFALWATSALAIGPVIFSNLVRWLTAERADAEVETELYLRRTIRSGDSGRAGEV